MSAASRAALTFFAIDGTASTTNTHPVLIAILGLLGSVMLGGATLLAGKGGLHLRRKPTELAVDDGDPVVIPPPPPGEPVIPIAAKDLRALYQENADARAHADELQRRLDDMTAREPDRSIEGAE